MLDVPSLSFGEVLLRLVVAALLGGAIGVERELRDREAGLRTHLLVSLGAALFTIVSAYGFRGFLEGGNPAVRADPTRIAAQIVTGIGFLGAGAIIRQGMSVRGLTTAASLWIVAAIGLAVGAGYYSAATIATVLVLVSLWPLRLFAHNVLSRLHADEARLLIQLTGEGSVAPVLVELERFGAIVRSLEFEGDEAGRSVSLHAYFPHGARPKVVERLGDLADVVAVRWS